MTMRPGKNLIRVLAAGLLISLATMVIPAIAWIWLPLLVSVLIAAVFDQMSIRRQLAELQFTRVLPPLAGRDREFSVRWSVVRQSGRQSIRGEFRDCFPVRAVPDLHVQPFEMSETDQELKWEQTVRIPERGRFSFGPLWVRISGPLGILEGQKSQENIAEIRIYPETVCSTDRLHQDPEAQIALLDKAARIRQHGVGTEFESLNEFRDGDDPRRIDWRTTARVGHLVIRRYEVERHRDVMLIIDCGRLMGGDADRGSKLDCAVDAALMLARVALRGGDRCGIALFDDQVRGYLPPQAGLSSMQAISEYVYAVRSQWKESDFSRVFATLQQRQQKRAMFIILSDMIDGETTHRFRASLATLAKRHVILFAALQTPVLNQIVSAPAAAPTDTTRQAIGYQLLRERERALHSVRRSGIEVLDVAPAQLTVPLINHFLELRKRSLL
jgi:uncharacterized protein (DUF58 family)